MPRYGDSCGTIELVSVVDIVPLAAAYVLTAFVNNFHK